MKIIFPLILTIGVCSCGNHSSENNQPQSQPDATLSPDSLKSIEIANFRVLRDAIYHGQAEIVKNYFKFPVLNDNNQIWSLALTEGKELAHDYQLEPLVPFTEKDFDRYFKKLFPKEFITSILKIKSEDLFRKDSSSTIVFDRDTAMSYQMIGSVDEKKKSFTTRP
jgi:hypothetical protein